MSDTPTSTPARPSGQGATILLLGFLILLLSCALILTVRVHVRLGALTEELIKLNAKIDGKPKPALASAESGGNTPATLTDAKTPTVTQTSLSLGERRSPIPQTGETITRPLTPAKLGEPEEVKPIAPEPAPGEVIPWDKAHLHMNRDITIEGRIVSTKRLATICFLNFTNEASGSESFYLVVFKDKFDDWGGFPEKEFLNKTVRVTGKVEDHKGRPQMKINKKEQVLKME